MGSAQLLLCNGNVDIVGGEETIESDYTHMNIRWAGNDDDSSFPGIDLKPYHGPNLRGLLQSDRWWTDGRFFATNTGKTSVFYSIKVGSPSTSLITSARFDVGGDGRFANGVRFPAQGDLSMGIYTNGSL